MENEESLPPSHSFPYPSLPSLLRTLRIFSEVSVLDTSRDSKQQTEHRFSFTRDSLVIFKYHVSNLLFIDLTP